MMLGPGQFWPICPSGPEAAEGVEDSGPGLEELAAAAAAAAAAAVPPPDRPAAGVTLSLDGGTLVLREAQGY